MGGNLLSLKRYRHCLHKRHAIQLQKANAVPIVNPAIAPAQPWLNNEINQDNALEIQLNIVPNMVLKKPLSGVGNHPATQFQN